MTRLLLHVEGETEESFVNEVLAEHLYALDYTVVSARIIGNARQRDRRGGIKPWPAVREGILNHLRQDTGFMVSTMVDYYGLPLSGVAHGLGARLPPVQYSRRRRVRLRKRS